jgi:hypothetical protein
MPLFDFACPDCGTVFEAVIGVGGQSAQCRYCFADAPRGTSAPPPGAARRLRAEARRAGTLDAEGEQTLGHFDHSDVDTLLDLDWDHQGTPRLRALHAELATADPALPLWEALSDELFAVYADAFRDATPEQDEDA